MSQMNLIGHRLGKYELRAEIGRGGMGTVYLGHDPMLERPVAVKVLAPHLVWEREFVQRFLREARAAARLKHPNIVTLYDVGEEGGWYYFVMEYLEGETLAKRLRRGPLSLEEALGILKRLADALDHAHRHSVVHRDVKPANVILEKGDRVVLTDFGIARAAQETRLTASGVVIGTPQYMSPEQAWGRPTDFRSDLYSLGVVAYEMLGGRPPFQGETPAVLHAHIYEPPPPVQSFNSAVPEEVEGVLTRMLAKEREERYQSAGEMARALREAVESKEQARRRGKRLSVLYGQLREAVENQDWSTAETQCRGILALEPEYQDVPELWMEVREARARQREVEELYEAARAKVESGAWAEARDLCQRIKALEPGYRDVNGLLRKAEGGLHREPAQKERQVRLVPPPEVKRTVVEKPVVEPSPIARPPREPEPRTKRKGMPEWAWASLWASLGVLALVVGVMIAVARPTPTPTPEVAQVVVTAAMQTKAPTDALYEELMHSVGDTWIRPTDDMAMVYVPDGTFQMGSDSSDTDASDDEFPQHPVTLDGFWIDRTEVTNAQYRQCVEAEVCQAPTTCDWGEPTYEDASKADHPVVCVDWYGAQAYCEWVGARLPLRPSGSMRREGSRGTSTPGETISTALVVTLMMRRS